MSDHKLLSNLGRHIYGLAAIALGIIGLVWGDFATVWQPVPDSVPHRTALAYIVAVCLLAAGAAIQWRRTARAGLLVLSFFYLVFACLWLRRVIGFPGMIGTWLGFAEQFALVLGGIIAYASLSPRHTMWKNRTPQIARCLFGLCAITFGLAHFLAVKETAGFVPSWIPLGQRFWAIATGAFHMLAGVAILTRIQDLLASRLFTVMLIGFGALVWAPIVFAHPTDHVSWAGNAINLAIAGAAWIVADSIQAAATAR